MNERDVLLNKKIREATNDLVDRSEMKPRALGPVKAINDKGEEVDLFIHSAHPVDGDYSKTPVTSLEDLGMSQTAPARLSPVKADEPPAFDLNPIRALIHEAFEDKDPGPAYKPGWKTTEFWLHVGGFAAAGALGYYGVVHDNLILTGIAAGLLGLNNAGYALGRSLAKAKRK